MKYIQMLTDVFRCVSMPMRGRLFPQESGQGLTRRDHSRDRPGRHPSAKMRHLPPYRSGPLVDHSVKVARGDAPCHVGWTAVRQTKGIPYGTKCIPARDYQRPSQQVSAQAQVLLGPLWPRPHAGCDPPPRRAGAH